MNISVLSVDDLAERCADDTGRFYRQQPYDPQFCFELLRRALADSLPDAFTRVHQIYSPQVLSWVYSHPRFPQTGENADYFASAALTNFYFALRGGKFEQFETLSQIMAYLKLCVHTTIAQYLRRQRAVTFVSLDEVNNLGHQPDYEDGMSAAELWAHICTLLPDTHDQLLAHCVFVQALKPAEIVQKYPQLWRKAREVSVALQRIRRILRNDDALRRWAGVES